MRFPRMTNRRWMVLVLAVAVLAVIILVLILPALRHKWWRAAIEYRIVQLAEKRPEEVSPKQWACCIHRTWNLHGNCGYYPAFHSSARNRFLLEFDHRLRGSVDLETINWIWDQYCLYSNGGAEYSRLYRPTTPDRLKYAEEDPFKENNLDWWLGELKRLRAER